MSYTIGVTLREAAVQSLGSVWHLELAAPSLSNPCAVSSLCSLGNTASGFVHGAAGTTCSGDHRNSLERATVSTLGLSVPGFPFVLGALLPMETSISPRVIVN